MTSIFSHRPSSAKSSRNNTRRPLCPRLPLKVEDLESRLTPAVYNFFNPVTVVLLNPDPLIPPSPCVQFDPQPVPSGLILPGATQTSDVVLHLQGQFAQSLTEMADSSYLLDNYQLDGPIQETVVPPGFTGAPGSITASYSLAGTMTEALYRQGATTPSLTVQASISFAGNLSATLYPPGPCTPPQTGMCQEIDGTFASTTALNQTETPSTGGAAWTVQVTVNTGGGFSQICYPPGPCRVSFSLQDQIHASVCPVSPPGIPPGPCTLIDAVFAASGTLVDGFVPAPPPSPQSNPVDLAGSYQFAGQLQETITPPPPSPTSAPTTETVIFGVAADGLFDQVSWPPSPA